MLLSPAVFAPVAAASAQRPALAPFRGGAGASLRRGVVGSRTARERGQPAQRRGGCVQAVMQAIQGTDNYSQNAGAGLTFTLSRKVDFGQQVVLIGDAPQLGSWELGHAPQMTWREGDTWTVTLDLPVGTSLEYKFVLTSPTHAPVWEQCDNRRVTVDPASVATLACEWDVPEAAVQPPEAPPAPAHWSGAYDSSAHSNGAYDVSSALSNGSAAAAAALSAAAVALETNDRAAALEAVQEATAAAAAVVAAAEATAAAVARAVQAAEALVSELDGGNGSSILKAATAQAAATTQAAADARYSAEQLEFMRRKLDTIQAMPAVSRQASPPPAAALRNGSSQPPRSASPARAAAPPAANGQAFTPDQLAFMQRKRAESQSPSPPTQRPRSSSPAPALRARSAAPAAPAQRAPAQRPTSPAPPLRPRSSSPARPSSAVHAKDMSGYSPEQVEFMRRAGKL